MIWKATWAALVGKNLNLDTKDNMDKMDKIIPSVGGQRENLNSVHIVHIVQEGENLISDSGLPFDNPDGDEITASYREGPPYPDGLGRVKCVYCESCEITGTKATCRVSGQSKNGIALLIECPDFAMKTVH